MHLSIRVKIHYNYSLLHAYFGFSNAHTFKFIYIGLTKTWKSKVQTSDGLKVTTGVMEHTGSIYLKVLGETTMWNSGFLAPF